MCRSSVCLPQASDPYFESVLAQIGRKWPQFLTDVLPNLSTIFQLTVLECLPSALSPIIILANTHLFYHPFASVRLTNSRRIIFICLVKLSFQHIRILQAFVLSHRVELLRSKYQNQYPNRKVGVIMLGDFNATFDSGAYRMLSEGTIPDTSDDWKFGTCV